MTPDDLTPALIALPYAARVVRKTFSSSLRLRLLSGRPAYCNYLPWFCRS